MIIFLIVVIIFLIILCIFAFGNRKKINTDITKKNDELLKQSQEILKYKYECESQLNNIKSDLTNIQNSYNKQSQEYEDLKHEKDKVKIIVNSLVEQESQARDRIVELSKNAEAIAKNQKELVQNAFIEWCDNLDKDYTEKENQYKDLINKLENAYGNKQSELLRESGKIREELDNLKKARSAAIEAARREKDVTDINNDDYRLNLEKKYIEDIKLLKSIQEEISNPIVIDKVIWSNYYQPLAKVKFPKIIGKATACGIYKITNIQTGEVYIGQSTDICERWKTHCKNALGVGTNTGTNRLYTNMKKYGLYNFTFELLEECDAKLLDEKEKYYIDFYDTYNFGLNSTKGNG